MAGDVVSSMTPMVRVQRLMGLFPVILHHDHISYSKVSLLALVSFFLPYCILVAMVLLFGWDRRNLSSKISVCLYLLELMVKGSAMVFLFQPIVDLVNDINISDKFLPSKPKTKNKYLWPILSSAVLFFISSCYFAGVSDLTSFLTRLLIALMHQRDYQQLIIFTFFVDQLCARFAIVRTMRFSSDNARLAHATLCRSVRKLSEGFGLRYFLIVVTVGFDQLCNVFQNAYLDDELCTIQGSYFFAVTDLSLISMFALLSQALMNQGKIISHDLLALNTTNMDLKNTRQVELFLEEVRTTELNITAWGIFRIDIGVFTSFIHTLLTFFIAMAGFSNEIIAITERYNLNN